ncbi:hypothetical protein V6Z11_D07G179300 [Gossypium hirsutum]
MVLMRFSHSSIASKMLKMRLLISSSTSSITNPTLVLIYGASVNLNVKKMDQHRNFKTCTEVLLEVL